MAKCSGYSMVELMVVVGLMSLVAMGTMTTSQHYFRSNATAMYQNEKIEFLADIRRALSDDDNCGGLLEDQDSVVDAGLTLTFPHGQMSAGSVYRTRIKIESAKLSSKALVAGDEYTGNLELVLSRGENVYGAPSRKYNYNISFLDPGTGKIENCVGPGGTIGGDPDGDPPEDPTEDVHLLYGSNAGESLVVDKTSDNAASALVYARYMTIDPANGGRFLYVYSFCDVRDNDGYSKMRMEFHEGTTNTLTFYTCHEYGTQEQLNRDLNSLVIPIPERVTRIKLEVTIAAYTKGGRAYAKIKTMK